jgi:hypothetical protein
MVASSQREDGKKEVELPITIGLESPAMLPSWPASCAGALTGLIGEKARGGNLTPVDQFQGKSTGGTWRGEMWVGDKIKMIFLRYVSKNAYFCNLKYFVDYEEIYIDSRIALYCIHR